MATEDTLMNMVFGFVLTCLGVLALAGAYTVLTCGCNLQ